MRDFELTGRVAVNFDQKGYSARLRWQHQNTDDALWLYSAFGSVLAELTVQPAGATLVTADRETYRSDNVQALTRDVLGWDLPLDGLRHWVVGRPDPSARVQSEVRDERSRLTRLVQHDWTIDYIAYVDNGVLPSGLTLRYQTLRLKLLIDRWQLADAAR